MTQQTQKEPEAWQLDTTAAEVYEELFVPTLFRGAAEEMVRGAELRGGERVLDVGCGTGIVGRVAADRVGENGRVAGCDLNPGMLSVARRLAPDLVWRQGDAAQLPFADDEFDVVLSQFALMFFADRRAALREMLRVVRPGGRVVVSVWNTLDGNPAYAELAAIAGERFGDEVRDVLASPFALGEPGEILDLFRSAGAENPTLSTASRPALFPSVRSWLYTEIRASPIAARLDEAGLDAFVDDLEPRFERLAERDGRARVTLSAHTVTARVRGRPAPGPRRGS